MMLRRSCRWNRKPRVKLCYECEIESRNGILNVKYDGLRFDRLEWHHIILREFMMSYLCRYCKVALVDLFGRVNVIGL